MNQQENFYDNLVDFVDPNILKNIGAETVEFVNDDDESRSVWKAIVKDCSDYLGMSKGKSGGSQSMPKNSNLYGPSLRKAVLTMSSKIHQTLFPAGAFVRSSITGESSREVEDRAERIEEWFNHYLFNVLKGYKSDKELLVLWYVICGSAFSKSYIDPVFQRPVCPYVHPDDLIISPDGSCLEDAERITHQFRISQREYQGRVRNGMYREYSLEQDSSQGISIQDHAKNKYGIREVPTDEKNKIYTFYESMRWLKIRDLEGEMLPYIVTVDRGSQQVLRLARNYDPRDPLRNRKNCYTQYKLFPGFGPYGMGMAHLTLDLARAETQTLNELIRAAELSNQPSLLHASGSIRKESTQINMVPGSINRMDTIDGNIGNAIMPLPTKEPSQVLFALMQSFGQSIEDISAVKDLRPDDIPPNASATTMMGILSTMHITEDAVINRLYDSFKCELSQFYTLFSEWLPDTPYPFSVTGGNKSIMRNDFRKDVIIQPIIDPNVSSQTFQLISNDTLLQLCSQAPDLYNIRAVHERSLRAMRISEIDVILKPEEDENPPPPPEIDPVTENQKIMKGEPIQVYASQDHESHNTVHGDMLQSLMEDESKQDMAAALQSHMNDHDSFSWAIEIQARMKIQIPEDPTQIPPEFQNQIAAKAAKAILKKQKEQQEANPPPPDPSVIMIEDLKVKQAQLAEQQQSNAQKFELERMKLESDRAYAEQELMLKQREFELDERKLQLDAQQAEMKFNMEAQQAEMKFNMENSKEQMRFEIETAKLQDKQKQVELEAENKAYDSTLKYESSKDAQFNTTNKE